MTRLEKLAASLPPQLDAGLITSDLSRRYYTDFLSSAGYLLVTRKNARLLIDSRYYEHAKSRVKDCEVILLYNLSEQLQKALSEDGATQLAVESNAVTLDEYRAIVQMLPNCSVTDSDQFSRLIIADRLLKTPQEIEWILQAQAIAEQAFEETLHFIRVGKTERMIASFLDQEIRKRGSQVLSFDTIVASGPNSAVPHAAVSDRPICDGDFIVMDFGATVAGYHSDMTRTVSVGQVSEEQKRVYNIVLQAQQAAIEAVKPNLPCTRIDAAARRIIDQNGYATCFNHAAGHGIGLEIHESPNISPKSEMITQAGMVFSVEPGIYLPEKFGVRIEDMVVVTENGCQNLTKTKKDLITL